MPCTHMATGASWKHVRNAHRLLKVLPWSQMPSMWSIPHTSVGAALKSDGETPSFRPSFFSDTQCQQPRVGAGFERANWGLRGLMMGGGGARYYRGCRRRSKGCY